MLISKDSDRATETQVHSDEEDEVGYERHDHAAPTIYKPHQQENGYPDVHQPHFPNGHTPADLVVADVHDPQDTGERCGIACCKPDFLQPLKNMKVFLVCFVIAGIAQGMFYTYWNMSLSTIEKRFQIPSKTTGIIAAINDVSHIAVVLFVAHFCGRGHRPRWMFVGCLTVGIAVLIFATPELFADRWDADTSTIVSSNSTGNKTFDKEMCLSTAQAKQIADQCIADAPNEVNKNAWTFVLLGLAQVILGIGTTAPIVLAMPFIDDNVKTKNTPIYFALGMTGRLFGPLIGVFLGSFCLSTYIDLSKKPNIPQTDPRWMGAWYLGFLITGTIICCVSTLYLFFPAKVPDSNPPSKKADKGKAEKLQLTEKVAYKPVVTNTKAPAKKQESLKEMFAAIPRDLKRLLVNKIFMCRVVNDCIDMLVVSGYFSFAPKYLEYHFGVSPADAGKAKGLTSILAVTCGAFIGGFVIRRLKLQPKHVALLICFSSFMISICYFFLMLVSCDRRNLYSSPGVDSMLIVNTQCSNNCYCDGRPFSPVCHEETGISYYSPCHAGCSEVFVRDKVKYYTKCSCLANSDWKYPEPLDGMTPTQFAFITAITNPPKSLLSESYAETGVIRNDTVKRGWCENNACRTGFWIYLIIGTSFKFIGSFPFSGNQMLSFRIVDPDLKSLSKAVRTLMASLFAFIPGPIIMGAVIDSACRLWNTQTCGAKGACLIYDLDSLRVKMHLIVAIVKTIACVMDFYVYYKVRNMKFERDPVAAAEPAEELAGPKGDISGSVKDLTANH
ncbi:solute carrier organic anion transporter family member 3A1-like [Paramacrobiotus metropolitanus]|uniref:solute carrier organic anion transporter family member 3A1-like n=1 Tax=Paramacrobiotus metropolitanus TaxID=2943436 RepID=UPI002445BB8A|nr:solute carrier organic anion transporter family member 3A1-like [Paramacrobiotus metropolitanus]